MDISGSPLENIHKSRTDRKRLHTKYKMFWSAQKIYTSPEQTERGYIQNTKCSDQLKVGWEAAEQKKN